MTPMFLQLSAERFSYVIASFLAVLLVCYVRAGHSDIPVLNPKKPYELTSSRVKSEYMSRAGEMLHGWFKRHPNKPVMLNADVGRVIVLPPSMANEIRNDKRLSFSKWSQEVNSLPY